MKSGLSTHRTLQLSALLDNLEERIRFYEHCIGNLSRLNSLERADRYRASSGRLTPIVERIRARISREQVRVAELDEARTHWLKLADDEVRLAKHWESLGRPFGSTDSYHVRADVYRRTSEALSIQIRTGVAVCSCCFKPFGQESRQSAL
jgi:hypothetical protein